MGFFLTDAIGSAFTPRGTNARRKQEEGQQGIGDLAGQIGKGAGANWQGVLGYTQGQNRNIQGGIDRLGQSTTQAGLRDNAIRGGNAARAQALSQSVPLQYMNNPWMAQAYRQGQLNRATDSQNQALQQANSPQAQANALGLLLQAVGQYQNQAYAPFGQAAGLVYGQPQVQVQPGLMSALPPFLGPLLQGNQKQGQSSQNMTQGSWQGPVFQSEYDIYEDEYGNPVDKFGNPVRM